VYGGGGGGGGQYQDVDVDAAAAAGRPKSISNNPPPLSSDRRMSAIE
jgi:hypothetical protein